LKLHLVDERWSFIRPNLTAARRRAARSGVHAYPCDVARPSHQMLGSAAKAYLGRKQMRMLQD
jgi:hypothetical protein